MFYDEEAVIQDADILQAQYEAESRNAARQRARGRCLHGSAVGVSASGEIIYPEQEGLTGTQQRCTEGCGMVFDSFEDWMQAHSQAAA